MSGFSWIADVHSPGLTEYKFNFMKDGKLNNAARYFNEKKGNSCSSLLLLGFSINAHS
jgi:hypothetical protein